ncbi:MAG: GFA family protein [Pseudomonadota bacterium]
MTRTGSCLCGAVRYAVDGPLRPVVACHCGQCRKATGNYVAATSAARGDVTIEGKLTWFQSSETARRGFCGTCGSQLFWDGPGVNLSIMAGSLDLPTGLTLAGHIYCEGRGDWYALPSGDRQVPGSDPELTTQVQT